MKPTLDNIITVASLAGFIFLFFLLAHEFILCYLSHLSQKQTKQKQAMENVKTLIAQTKGKFFSITFEKKDGTIRTINSKDKYFRLIKGTGSPATAALKSAGYVSAVNRNAETWFSFLPEKVKSFKCGAIEKTF